MVCFLLAGVSFFSSAPSLLSFLFVSSSTSTKKKKGKKGREGRKRRRPGHRIYWGRPSTSTVCRRKTWSDSISVTRQISSRTPIELTVDRQEYYMSGIVFILLTATLSTVNSVRKMQVEECKDKNNRNNNILSSD